MAEAMMEWPITQATLRRWMLNINAVLVVCFAFLLLAEWHNGNSLPIILIAALSLSACGVVVLGLGESTSAPPAPEVDPALRNQAFLMMFVGLIGGAAVGAAASWLGVVPSTGPVYWNESIYFGAAIGAYLLARPLTNRVSPEDAVMSGLFGALIGAAFLFAVTALWIFVVSGKYDAATNVNVALKGCWFVGVVQAWRRSAELKIYRGLRLVLGLLLSAIGGVVFTYIFTILAFPTFVQSMISPDAGLFLRSLVVGGGLIGLSLYLVLRFGVFRHVPLRGLFSGTVAGLTATIDTAGKVALFFVGVCFMIAAVALWWAGTWWWSHLGILGELKDVIGYAIYGFSVLTFIQGLRLALSTLKVTPQLQNSGAHGTADIATEQQAVMHERGEGGRGKVHTQRF
jgi:hypothetical protein